MSDEKQRFDTRHLNATASARALASVETGLLTPGLPWILEFRVVGSAAVVQTRLKDEILLGRADPERNMSPEVDLTPFDALAKGVSRRHAAIRVRNGRVTINDLGSLNGTQLNHAQLVGDTEYRLRHGDELALGQLQLKVSFSVVPAALESDDSLVLREALRIPKVGNGQHVMVVSDDGDVVAVFQSSLVNAGFRVSTARIAESAVSDIADRKPDAIIVDMALPDESGLELLRFIRKTVSSSVPLIVTCAATAGYHQTRSLEAGANVFLGKPVSVAELVSAVDRAISPSKT